MFCCFFNLIIFIFIFLLNCSNNEKSTKLIDQQMIQKHLFYQCFLTFIGRISLKCNNHPSLLINEAIEKLKRNEPFTVQTVLLQIYFDIVSLF